MFWIRGDTAAFLEFTKTFIHRPQLRDDHGEWSRIDCFNDLFLFYNSRIKNRVFVFVRFDVLYFNSKNK